MSQGIRPSLKEQLNAAGSGKQVVAYLTIGDPAERFVEIAGELLAAGALALELGFPYPEPKEGPALFASHQRALNAGFTPPRAMEMLKSVSRAYPSAALLAVVQWPAIKSEDLLGPFLDDLADAGAAAILPVGLPLWQLPALAARVHERGMQTVLACPPDTSRAFRGIAFRFCSGGIYVPRGRLTGSAQQTGDAAEFCNTISTETELPIIVGVGIKSAADVAEVCRTPAKAAAVGSALVEHILQGGSPGEFVRRLIAS